MAPPDRPPASSNPFAVLDEAREDFVATFAARCDHLGLLVDNVREPGAGEAMASLTEAVHRLAGLAGTIGFPTISLRAFDLENLLGTTTPFDPTTGATLVDAIRAALEVDLAIRALAPRAVITAPADRLSATDPPDALTAHTVLIAEDDPDVTRVVDAELRAAGYLTVFAFDGEQTLAAIREQAPDVVVLDLMMPKLGGFEVLTQLRDGPPPRPRVIVLSARAREEDLSRGFSLGADDYLTKPFDPHELTARIARLLK